MANLLVIYYSAYGHVFSMAQAVADGAARHQGNQVRLVRITETNPPHVTDQSEAASKLQGTFNLRDRASKYEAALALQRDIPFATIADLRWADGIVWGFPTYFGMMPSQVKLFLEQAGALCANGELEGIPAGVFTSTASIHTGHEATILTSIVPLLHFGMIFVGLPYTENPEYLTADAIGCSPYGASTLAGPDSSLTPDPRELMMAARLGARVAHVAEALLQSKHRWT